MTLPELPKLPALPKLPGLPKSNLPISAQQAFPINFGNPVNLGNSGNGEVL
jgi:hypothetical protein